MNRLLMNCALHFILIRDIPLMTVLSLSILFFGINLRSLDV